MSMHYWMPLPRQEGSFITSIGGKRCTAVPRNVQPTKAPSPAQPATSQQQQPAPVRTSAQPVENTPAADPTPTSAQAIEEPVTRVSEAPADQTPELTASDTGTPATESIPGNGGGKVP